MATARNVPRSEFVKQAYERIRDMIVDGRLAPGAPLIETEIAGMLGLSRSHVRAAFQRLELSGFVVSAAISSYSRTRVAPLTIDDARDLFLIVGSLEGLAARKAALLPLPERQPLLEEMDRLNTELSGALRSAPQDYNRANDLDVAFHRAYVERAAGSRLFTLHQTVKPQAERYERLYMTLLINDTSASVEEHAAIVDALSRGNADAAQRAVEVNWRNAADRFSRIMASVGERGRV